jgi:adenylate kinase family enzyme
MAPTIIALTGKICSGKTTFAKYIQQKTGGKIFSFSTGVKKYAELLFETKETETYKNRKIYQRFAEKMKEIDPDIWVKMTINSIKESSNNSNNNICIIDDLRFPNEYNSLKELQKDGFKVIFIRLFINYDLQKMRIKKLYENSSEHLERLDHVSEQYINNFIVSYEIGSGYSLEEIKGFIDNILIKEDI